MNIITAFGINIRCFFVVMMFVLMTAKYCMAYSNKLFVKVSDEMGTPVEYAAVSITGANSVSVGGLTDNAGLYSATLKPGEWSYRVSSVGYNESQGKFYFPMTSTDTLSVILTNNSKLKEVVVTAREMRGPTSVSVIDQSAMKHLQPSSLTDLMGLLPGGTTVDPDMSKANTASLREASTTSHDGNYLTSALGTSFVIDGVPVNTSASLQSSTDGSRDGRSTVGKGVDMRGIATDDIESVEVVRGIPSVEYGELTSGLVRIKRKSGASRLTLRFKADMQSTLFSVDKGLDVGKKWILNLSAGYLDSKIDPRNTRENFKRVNGSARVNRVWKSSSINVINWNVGFGYTGVFERDDNDPDLTVNNTRDFYSSSVNTLDFSTVLGLNRSAGHFLRELKLTGGLSYSIDNTDLEKTVVSSRLYPMPVSMRPGANDVGFLPMIYLAQEKVEGRPMTAYLKTGVNLDYKIDKVINTIKAGVEWNFAKNYGRGRIYDLDRPMVAGNTTRPRSFRSIPAIHQASSYIENGSTWRCGSQSIDFTVGLRATTLLNLGKRHTLNGKVYLDPRVNVAYTLPSINVSNFPLSPQLSGGVGMHTKMPVAAYLFPDPLYTDYVQLNYYNDDEQYRRMNVMTFVEDVTNYDLRAARNLKWELRTDWTYRGNRISITYFRENMKDGFRRSGEVHRYSYRVYDVTGYDPAETGTAPSLDNLPFHDESRQTVVTRITNGSQTKKEGIEYTFSSLRLPIIRTRITISGAYFKTTNVNSQPLWYKPTVILNGKELQYVGLYDDTDGAVYKSFNTNIMFDTDIPRLGLNFSLSVQNMWFTSSQSLWRNGVPIAYMDPDGNIHEFSDSDLKDPYLANLVRDYSLAAFDLQKVPVSTTFNIKATKNFLNDRVGLALFVNRLVSIAPDYSRYGVIIRRYSSPYFGMELNFKI